MPSLKEIKGCIASVQSTLKITSAMKLVASAKLRKAQQAIEAMRPYEASLQQMYRNLLASVTEGADAREAVSAGEGPERVAIVAIASNSSLCGSFNANAVARVKDLLAEHPLATVYSVGRKMADAMRKAGRPSPKDFSALAEHPSYGAAADLAEDLAEDFEKGKYTRIYLVYNHFVSTAKQVPTVETFLPRTVPAPVAVPSAPVTDYIVEPAAGKLLEALYPKTLKLKLYTALLDSAAAEHAARTVAMQTATDNAENLLTELTLQYNKGRQQKITSEILDLAGGQAENQ